MTVIVANSVPPNDPLSSGTVPPARRTCDSAGSRVDWPAIAQILGQRSTVPLALLDRSGRVRMFNRAMEGALGWSRFDVEGKAWQHVFVEVAPKVDPNRWFGEAMAGALHSHDITALTRSGSRVQFTFELSLVGRSDEQGLLLTATRVVPVVPLEQPERGRDFEYDIQLVGQHFRRLMQVCTSGERVALPGLDSVCHATLYGSGVPCEDCPVRPPFIPGMDLAPCVRYRRLETPQGVRAHLEVTTGHVLDETTVRLRVRTLTDEALNAVHEAKLKAITEQYNLTTRERDVLRYLVLGRSLTDIASILNITERTVKYHQANLIDKVGADSRADLARLLF